MVVVVGFFFRRMRLWEGGRSFNFSNVWVCFLFVFGGGGIGRCVICIC